VIDIHTAQRIAIRIVGLHAYALAFGERVGVSRCAPRVLGRCVEGEGRVDVGIAEEGALQRVVGAALGTFLGAFEGHFSAKSGALARRESTLPPTIGRNILISFMTHPSRQSAGEETC
jgi:hypothetical protein